MPECPRDGSKLVKLVDGLAVIYVCADDSGVWVPAKSLKAFTKRSQKSMAADTAIALAFGAPKDGRARCPEDGVAMGLRSHGGTTIDLCPHCGGVWLDAAEAGRFFKVKRPVTLTENLSKAGKAAEPALLVAGGVADLATLILQLASIFL